MPDLLCQIEMQLWVSVKVEFMMQSRSNGDQIVHSVCNCNANLKRVFFEDWTKLQITSEIQPPLKSGLYQKVSLIWSHPQN